ncbi:MAG: M48 family metalloprotease, partial [Erysipelotrichaceae bacterium]|nr:M48 family metalloprotease [Erysipelotrichaceae bacterium]
MSYLVIGIIVFMTGFNIMVDTLNVRHHKKTLPPNVATLYDEKRWTNWLNYKHDNYKLGVIMNLGIALLVVSLLLFGVFGQLEKLVASMTPSLYLQTLLFLEIIYWAATVISIPVKYVRIFRIDAKYGFNKTTIKLFVLDSVKTLIMVSVIGGGIVLLLGSILIRFEEDLVLYLSISYGVIVTITLLVFMFNGFFIRAFNKLTPLEEGSLKEKIQKLASSLGFSIKRISVMDASKRSTKLNAFFTGLGKTREVVLYDTLIEKLS